MWKDFKEFAFRGNVIDLAIGIVIGAAFGAIITSFVNNLVNPLIGVFIGKTDLANMFLAIPPGDYATAQQAQAGGAAVFTYGALVNAIINFLLVALVLFLAVKAVNRFRAADVTTKSCPFCITTIPVEATRCPACTSELAAQSVSTA